MYAKVGTAMAWARDTAVAYSHDHGSAPPFAATAGAGDFPNGPGGRFEIREPAIHTPAARSEHARILHHSGRDQR